MIQIQNILDILSKITDPQSGKDVVTSQMVQVQSLSEQKVHIDLKLPTLQHPSKQELNFAIIQAVQEAYPQLEVHTHVSVGQPPAQQQSLLPQIKNIIAVASGKGGVGKSTVSVNLALALKELGARVGILDADIYGPSVPIMLGIQGQRPKIIDIDGKPMMVPIEKYGVHSISIGNIIEAEQAVVLRGPRLASIINQFFKDCLWPELDFLIIDLPPGTGDVQLTLVQTVQVSGVVMVTTPQKVALADAIKGMNMFRLPNVNVPILGVVENMSWFTPLEYPELKYPIFGTGAGKSLAKDSSSVLLGQVPLVMGIREGGDEGKPFILEERSHNLPFFIDIAKNMLRQLAVLQG